MNFEFKSYSLRKPKEKDAQGFLNISQDEEVMKYYGEDGAFFENLEEARQQVEWCLQQFNENAGRWIIIDSATDEYIGDIGFCDFVDSHKRVELGFRLSRSYWGRGIVSNFLGQILPWGFSELGYNRMEALVDTRNTGSKRVLLKNGFQQEGLLREYEFEHGHYVDLEMYSLLKKEFSH